MSYGGYNYGGGQIGGGPSAAAEVLLQNPELAESLLSEVAQFAGDQAMEQLLQLARMAIENQELFEPFSNLVLWLFLGSVAYAAQNDED